MYEDDLRAMVTEDIKVYQERTGIKLDAHNKQTLRLMLMKENDYYFKESVRQDNNTGRDNQ